MTGVVENVGEWFVPDSKLFELSHTHAHTHGYVCTHEDTCTYRYTITCPELKVSVTGCT